MATRAREIAGWLAEPRLFWTTIAIVVAAIGLAIRPGATEFEVRLIAAALQLLGVIEVSVGIRDTRRLFGRPGIVEYTRDWWKRFPTGSKTLHVGTGHVVLQPLEANLRGTALRFPGADAPVEERLAALEHNLGESAKRLDRTEADINRVAQEHRERLDNESRLRAEADAANRKLVEVTQTGGLALSTAGAVWLVLGIVLGAFPEEIAGLFGK